MIAHARQSGSARPAAPESDDRAGFPSAARQQRQKAQTRRTLIMFALALTMAVGAVLMLIGTGSVQALPVAAAVHAKANDWVGIAAVASVLVSAVAGTALVHRHVTLRRR